MIGVINIINRILDSNGDYTFGKNLQNYTYGTYAVGLAIKSRLKLLYGEWFMDTSDGLQLFDSIIGASGTPENILVADSLIKERILGTTDVTKITSFSSSYESRTYSFSATIETKYGTVTVSTDI